MSSVRAAARVFADGSTISSAISLPNAPKAVEVFSIPAGSTEKEELKKEEALHAAGTGEGGIGEKARGLTLKDG